VRAIVDADTPAYIAAVVTEGLPESEAFYSIEKWLDKLSARLNGLPMTLYLTGKNNFRYDIFPEYKASRRNKPRPTHLAAVNDYLIKNHNAVISDGCESDDLCGIDQVQSNSKGEDTILCHIDKDLDMIPGKHYNWEIVREGVLVREEKEYIVSPTDAIRHFYHQLLTGDSGDGIKGAPGIGKIKAKAILNGLDDELDLLEASKRCFSCDEELELNGKCLWIWREENGIWKIPDQSN
jgi:5'-3' exonuclease